MTGPSGWCQASHLGPCNGQNAAHRLCQMRINDHALQCGCEHHDDNEEDAD